VLLHGSVDTKGLSWNMRMTTALGTARVFEYVTFMTLFSLGHLFPSNVPIGYI
jgi:hypothetical protein